MGVAASLFNSANDSEKQTLHRRITPTEDQFEAQKARWNALADHLLADLKNVSGLSMRSWLQGSYKFGTQVRPPSKFEEFDIDLGVYFEWSGKPEDGDHDANELQTLVQLSLKKYAKEDEDIKEVLKPPKKRCCRVHYKDSFHIDVPCYHLDPAADTRNLATTDGWESSDPKALYIWFKDEFDEAARIKVRRQIRYLKTWAALKWKPDGGRPSSVLLTVLASNAAKSCDLTQQDDDLFHDIVDRITTRLSRSTVVPNPVETTEDLNRLDAAQNEALKKGFVDLRGIAARALAEADEGAAAIVWSEAFGHFFPMPDPEEQKSESARVLTKSQALVPIDLPDIAVSATTEKNSNLRWSGTNSIGPIPKDCAVQFKLVDAWKLPAGATVEWIVRNGDGEAETLNDLGHSCGFGTEMKRDSAYNGTHFMDVIFRAGGRILGVRRVPVTVRGIPIPPRNPPRPFYARITGRR